MRMRHARQEDAVLRRHWTLYLFWSVILVNPADFVSAPSGCETHFATSARAEEVTLWKNRSATDDPISALGFEAASSEDELLSDDEPPFVDAGAGVPPRSNDNDVALEMGFQILPTGLMYRSYLAGEKEPRFQSVWLNETGRGLVWETQMGGRVGLLRY